MKRRIDGPSRSSEERSGPSPRLLRMALLVMSGLLIVVAALGTVQAALAEDGGVLAVIMAFSFVLYLSAFVGIIRHARWGYWVALIVGIVQVVGGIASGGVSVGLSNGLIFAILSAMILFPRGKKDQILTDGPKPMVSE